MTDPKKLFSAPLTTNETDIATPAGEKWIVTDLWIVNHSAAEARVTIKHDSDILLPNVKVPANEAIIVGSIVVAAANVLKGQCSAVNSVNVVGYGRVV